MLKKARSEEETAQKALALKTLDCDTSKIQCQISDLEEILACDEPVVFTVENGWLLTQSNELKDHDVYSSHFLF